MSANLFPRKFESSPWTDKAHGHLLAAILNSEPSQHAHNLRVAEDIQALNRRRDAAQSFTNASRPIFESDFPKYGVSPIARPKALAQALILPLPNGSHAVVAAPIPAVPLELKNERIYALGGVPRAFLRVQYYVQPVVGHAADVRLYGKRDIYGRVSPKEAEYLIESAPGAFQAISEWTSVNALPLALRRIEESNRPNHEALGYSESDLLELAGEDGAAADHE